MRGITIVLHGDDFVSAGPTHQLEWLDKVMDTLCVEAHRDGGIFSEWEEQPQTREAENGVVEGTIKVRDADGAHQIFARHNSHRIDGCLSQHGAARQRFIEASMSTLLYRGLKPFEFSHSGQIVTRHNFTVSELIFANYITRRVFSYLIFWVT